MKLVLMCINNIASSIDLREVKSTLSILKHGYNLLLCMFIEHVFNVSSNVIENY